MTCFIIYSRHSAFDIRRCLTFCHTTEKHTNFIDFSSPCIGYHCRHAHGERRNNGGQTTRSPCFDGQVNFLRKYNKYRHELTCGRGGGRRPLPWHNKLNKYAYQPPDKTPRTRNLAPRSPRTHSIHRGQEKYNRWQMVVYRIVELTSKTWWSGWMGGLEPFTDSVDASPLLDYG